MAELRVTLTCPSCGHAALETMPRDRCVFFCECRGCRMVPRPKAGA